MTAGTRMRARKDDTSMTAGALFLMKIILLDTLLLIIIIGIFAIIDFAFNEIIKLNINQEWIHFVTSEFRLFLTLFFLGLLAKQFKKYVGLMIC
ncbi:MAG: hypothetical protein ACFFDN_48225 [Candidatus Hodarchaeota archaeon]